MPETNRKTRLVVTRKEGQAIKIGDDITVTVHSLSGKDAQIAVQAPADVKVFRTELLDE